MTRPAEAFARGCAMAAADGHSAPGADHGPGGARITLEPGLGSGQGGGRPRRIQRRRARGWRLPENATCVDRSTRWGNPFVVGRDGTAAECVRLYGALLAGSVCLTSRATPAEQMAARSHVLAHVHKLRGRDLACFCREGAVCHGDVLLALAARPPACEAA